MLPLPHRSIAKKQCILVMYTALDVYQAREPKMRVLAFVATAITAPLLANAQSGETVKFNCDVSHIHEFKSDGKPFQPLEKDTKAQYVITIGNDAIRAEMKSASRNEVVFYRVLIHNSTDYIGAMAPEKPSGAAIGVSKQANANDMHSGIVTTVAGGSIKMTALICLKAQ
jgi:hypothetical protein